MLSDTTMSEANNHSDFEEISDVGETEQLLNHPGQDIRTYGYMQRRRVTQAGNFIYPDHGTFLGFKLPSSDITQDLENPIAVALKCCEEKVLKPYNLLLKLVAWQPLFDAYSKWQVCVNWCYPALVVIIIILGCFVQYETCFRRDRAGEGLHDEWEPLSPSMSNTTADTTTLSCHELIISEYIVPDLLHFSAYVYSFYVLRILQTEQIPMLTEKVFLKTSPTESGFLSQGNLIRRLRYLLYGGITWVILSQAATIIHVIAQFGSMEYHLLDTSSLTGRIFIVVFMCFSFIPLDLVYVCVVINYCIQCSLLIFFVEGLQRRLMMKSIALMDAKKEIGEIEAHLKFMNQYSANACSIVMVNFATMIFSGSTALFEQLEIKQALMFIATACCVVLWSVLMIVPLVWGARTTAACNSLRKIGHVIRCRPFGYEEESDSELDSFLIYVSTTGMRAKLFLIPVRSSRLCIVLVIIVIVLMLLFQAGIIELYF